MANPHLHIRAPAPPSDKWFVVRHRRGPRDAILDTTIAELRAEGYEYYRPMFARLKRVGTKMEMVPEALFRDYMFIRPTGQAGKPFMSIHGIDSSFRAAVLDQVIEKLRREEVNDLIHFVERNDPTRAKIKLGDTVKTLDGWFEAVVSEKLPDGRLALLSAFMDGSARFTVSLASVVKVRDSEDGQALPGAKVRKTGKGESKKERPGDAARRWAQSEDDAA